MESRAVPIVGRDDEQERLSAFVTAATGGSLVLRGETGVGKSVLLEYAVELALHQGHTVVRATGVEAEAGLPYAGLHQLLYPLLPKTTGLDAETRAVFDAVFGHRDISPPSIMTLGIAVLNLLSEVAVDRTLLLVLDDAQWFDDGSAEVCGFVGRRLTGSAVKVLIAVRADVASRFDTAALPETAVPALSAEAAARLLDDRYPALDGSARRLILEHARGNPLALLELPTHLDTRSRTPEEVFGAQALPLPRRLQHLYSARIAALGEDVRAELLRGALDGVGAGPGPDRRYRMDDVDAAVSSGLVDIDPLSGDLTFRHPLVRSAVVQMATPNQRRAAHAALARVHRDNLERRASHLAAATVDPDEQVAALLEAAAVSATRRGGAVSAVAWLTRAAELSETAHVRSRRLADAAFIAGHSARLGQAQRIVQLDPAPDGRRSAAAVLASEYLALYGHGDVRSAHRQVAAAIEALGAEESPEVRSRLVTLLLATSQYAGDAVLWARTHQLLDAQAALCQPLLRIYSATWSDVVRHGASAAADLEKLSADLAQLDPWDVTRLSVSAYHLDVLGDYRPYLQRIVDRELATGAAATGITMLHLIMLDQMATGAWEDAEQTGRRSLERAEELDYGLFAHQSRSYLAQLAALRGRYDEARELHALVDSWARPRGVGFLTQAADAAATTVALSEGDFETAYLLAIGITAPGEFAPYTYQASRSLLDLVEAAIGSGRAEQARTHALAARAAGLPDISPRLALVTFGALAMTAEDDAEAAEMMARAENHAAARRFPFELARIRLAHGLRLRSTSGETAQRYLSTAADMFGRLGAPAWAERARTELRAADGETRSAAIEHTVLTAQERRIAELAAGGLTNKEIGRQLYLSPRTVSSHLYRIFPKLGVTTRAALRDALNRQN
ncbi:AAA family ATPase [Nocardia xishanensis]|uniref:AAA family ATPase n=1 Tax=Nocardia xishanensis TaxID=238964 RepID=UPI00341DF72F